MEARDNYIEFLEEGWQTKLTGLVKKHAQAIQSVPDETIFIPRHYKSIPSEYIYPIFKTCIYISTLPKVEGYHKDPQTDEEKDYNRMIRRAFYRKRDLDQILEEGLYNFCSDVGVVFRGLMIAQGIRASYVQAFNDDCILENKPGSHVFSRVFMQHGRSIIVDPNSSSSYFPDIYKSELELFPYIIFREGLDSWNIGILSARDLVLLKDRNYPDILAKFEQTLDAKFKDDKISHADEVRKKGYHESEERWYKQTVTEYKSKKARISRIKKEFIKKHALSGYDNRMSNTSITARL